MLLQNHQQHNKLTTRRELLPFQSKGFFSFTQLKMYQVNENLYIDISVSCSHSTILSHAPTNSSAVIFKTIHCCKLKQVLRSVSDTTVAVCCSCYVVVINTGTWHGYLLVLTLLQVFMDCQTVKST